MVVIQRQTVTEADVARLAALAGLRIDPGFVAGVCQALATLLDQGELLTWPPVPAEIEPAPVFRP